MLENAIGEVDVGGHLDGTQEDGRRQPDAVLLSSGRVLLRHFTAEHVLLPVVDAVQLDAARQRRRQVGTVAAAAVLEAPLELDARTHSFDQLQRPFAQLQTWSTIQRLVHRRLGGRIVKGSLKDCGRIAKKFKRWFESLCFKVEDCIDYSTLLIFSED